MPEENTAGNNPNTAPAAASQLPADQANAEAKRDPLDHDGDGRKGGSLPKVQRESNQAAGAGQAQVASNPDGTTQFTRSEPGGQTEQPPAANEGAAGVSNLVKPVVAAGNSLQVTDAASEAVAVAPRVSLADIEAAIAARYDINAERAVHALQFDGAPLGGPLALLSVCILVMRNGFTVIGKSAPASKENYNAELGKKFAYEDAVRQLWPLMGFSLRDQLASNAVPPIS